MTIVRRLLRFPGFAVWFAWQMLRANAQVAADLLTPGSASTPAIVAYRTRRLSPMELSALTSLITLTPGTLTIDVDGDEQDEDQVLYVLGLYAPADARDFHAELRELEDRLLRVVRPARDLVAEEEG